MKDRNNKFFSILILVMVFALISTNFNDSSVSQVYGEAEPTVFAKESESNLPPLPLKKMVEAPLPDEKDAIDIETFYKEFVEEANDIVSEPEPVVIKEEFKTKRRRIFGGTSRASKSYGLKKFLGRLK